MRINAMIKRIFWQMLRDKRTLAMLFVAPLLILTLMYFLFNTEAETAEIGAVNVEAEFLEQLQKVDIHVQEYVSANEQTILEEDLDGLIMMDQGEVELLLQNNDPSSAKALQVKISQALSAQMKEITPVTQMPKLSTSYIYGDEDTSFFDVLSPVLVGFFVFFFVFLISGIGLLRERTTGTLERLLSTPIRRWEIVVAYLAGYGVFAIIQTVIVVLYAVQVLDIIMVGSIWNVLLINLLLALVALSLGILLSAFASSEFQMVQFIPVVVIPQIFFAGIFPLDSMARWLQAVAKIMPMYYAGGALKEVMYKGLTLHDISRNLLMLAAFAVILIGLNILALKKYRTL